MLAPEQISADLGRASTCHHSGKGPLGHRRAHLGGHLGVHVGVVAHVGVLARVPLDEGSLTGALKADTTFEPEDFRAWYFRDGRINDVIKRVEDLEAATANIKGTLAQRALRFILSSEAVSVAIPGMRRNSTVESNCAVSDLGPLSPEELEIMRHHVWLKNYYR